MGDAMMATMAVMNSQFWLPLTLTDSISKDTTLVKDPNSTW
jgi:hypothetical protein